MAKDDAVKQQQVLDTELVALAVAARIAYEKLTDPRTRTAGEGERADITRLAAIALSTVASIYRRGPGGGAPSIVSHDELKPLLYGKLQQKWHVELDGLYVRRGELRGAIESLREARRVFRPAR